MGRCGRKEWVCSTWRPHPGSGEFHGEVPSSTQTWISFLSGRERPILFVISDENKREDSNRLSSLGGDEARQGPGEGGIKGRWKLVAAMERGWQLGRTDWPKTFASFHKEFEGEDECGNTRALWVLAPSVASYITLYLPAPQLFPVEWGWWYLVTLVFSAVQAVAGIEWKVKYCCSENS